LILLLGGGGGYYAYGPYGGIRRSRWSNIRLLCGNPIF
jgi:hypothetical protein